MIYLMHEAESGHYKIGMSMSPTHAYRRVAPAARERSKLAGRRVKIKLVLWVPWPHTDEKCLHRYLWQSWAGGEWFSDSERLREVIGYLQRNDYFRWRDAFRAAEPSLPQWGWSVSRNRNIIKHDPEIII